MRKINMTPIQEFFEDNDINYTEMAKATKQTRQNISYKVNGKISTWKFEEIVYLVRLTKKNYEYFVKMLNINL